MSIKASVSISDQQDSFARALVSDGRFSSVSAVVQRGLELLCAETERQEAELHERGVRLFLGHRADHASDNAAYKAIAPKLGCSPDSLRGWC